MKGPKTTRLEETEKPERDEDAALVRQLEDVELGYEWERSILEEASRRVFNERRPLMLHQRAEVEEIIARRRIR